MGRHAGQKPNWRSLLQLYSVFRTDSNHLHLPSMLELTILTDELLPNLAAAAQPPLPDWPSSMRHREYGRVEHFEMQEPALESPRRAMCATSLRCPRQNQEACLVSRLLLWWRERRQQRTQHSKATRCPTTTAGHTRLAFERSLLLFPTRLITCSWRCSWGQPQDTEGRERASDGTSKAV